jgi:hypothetical protein
MKFCLGSCRSVKPGVVALKLLSAGVVKRISLTAKSLITYIYIYKSQTIEIMLSSFRGYILDRIFDLTAMQVTLLRKTCISPGKQHVMVIRTVCCWETSWTGFAIRCRLHFFGISTLLNVITLVLSKKRTLLRQALTCRSIAWICIIETYMYEYSRLSSIRAWFNRFAAQPRQCIFKEKKFIFGEYHICLNVFYASQC